jgi:hypothetical protein
MSSRSSDMLGPQQSQIYECLYRKKKTVSIFVCIALSSSSYHCRQSCCRYSEADSSTTLDLSALARYSSRVQKTTKAAVETKHLAFVISTQNQRWNQQESEVLLRYCPS